MPRIDLRLQPLPELDPYKQPVLAEGRVRYVGEPIAVILADSVAIGEDALDLIEVEIEDLAPETGQDLSGLQGERLFEGTDRNVAITYTAIKGDAAAAFADAPYTRRETFRIQRHAAIPMEPRGFVAEWNADSGKLTVTGAAKVPFANRRILARAIGLPEDSVEMIEVDVGGGFGSRGEFYPEDFLIPFAAKFSGRPVKWTEDRREHLMASNHARDVTCEIEIACTKDGTILGLRGHAYSNIGAYIRTNGSVGPRNVAQFLSGPYRVPNIHIESTMLLSNRTPSGTYRGPGRFEADFIRERMFDLVAADLGIDRVEFRKRNLVSQNELPYPLATINPFESKTELDSGDYHVTLDKCLAGIRLDGEVSAARQADRRPLPWRRARLLHRGRRCRSQGGGTLRARGGRVCAHLYRFDLDRSGARDDHDSDRCRCARTADGLHRNPARLHDLRAGGLWLLPFSFDGNGRFGPAGCRDEACVR